MVSVMRENIEIQFRGDNFGFLFKSVDEVYLGFLYKNGRLCSKFQRCSIIKHYLFGMLHSVHTPDSMLIYFYM